MRAVAFPPIRDGGKWYPPLLFASSWAIVAFGQPLFSTHLSLLSSSLGFTLFWIALFRYEGKVKRFSCSAFWFSCVQGVQLSWMAAPEYQGVYILFVYVGLSIWLGLQFGLLNLLLPLKPPLNMRSILLLASTWTVMEWTRLFIACGFAWNPVGLTMMAHPVPAQMATVLGIFGLSFWVMLVNLLGVQAVFSLHKPVSISYWGSLLLFPYLFGMAHIAYRDGERAKREARILRVALVQPSLLPDQKCPLVGREARYVSPCDQWRAMIRHVKELEEGCDLIVFPESAAPFSAFTHLYPYERVVEILQREWQCQEPSLNRIKRYPYAEYRGGNWYASNAFWSQALANHLETEVIIGLDDTDNEGTHYAAAFHFLPHAFATDRYEKRVLVPLAEYLPMKFLAPLVAQYGISEFFTHGKEAKLFQGVCPLGISICYEECFGHLMQESRKKGAELFINVTNDGWYPSSRLPKQHFDHGRVRAIENGVPVVRACNTGVTAGVDSLGRTIGILDSGEGEIWKQKGVLSLSVDLYSYRTLYTLWGDYGVVLPSLCIVFLGGALSLKRFVAKRRPALDKRVARF